MKPRRIVLLLTAFILVFTTFSYAGEFDQRITRAYEQLERGIHSGSISRAEALRLKDELGAVRDAEAHMQRDGRLDQRERQRLDFKLERLEENIYRAKSNDRRGHGDRGHGPAHHGGINVISGTYGENCGAEYGNATPHLAEQCDGLRQCSYRINYKIIGDPARGCQKDYIARWRCGNGPVHTTSASPEAGEGSVITLFCQ